MSKTIKIPGRIESVATGKVVTGANAILDDTKGKKQNVINEETDAELLRLDQEKQGNLTFDQTPTENSTNPVTSGGVYAADQVLSQAIEAILLLIPSAASELNKLVDLATMNSSISTATASFKGTYNLVSDLHLTVSATHAQIAAALDALSLGADNNDYAFVQVPNTDTAPTDIAKTERYKFNGENWAYEYDLNNSGFTTAQWNAINSGITTLLVAKLSALPTNEALTLALAGKQDSLTFDNAPTAGSNNPVKSGGIYTRNNEIVALINALDAAKQNVLTFDTTPTNGSTNPVTSNGVYLAIQLVQTAVVALDGRMGTAETKISTAEGNIVNLQAAYAALTQSDIVVVSGALPSSGQQQNIIYRQPDQDHTPPQFYSDYMWNGTAWVLMATYNNAIDPRPKKGSQNLVTSGGVFDNMGALDVSELNATENPHTLKRYATLDAALADIHSDYQKGGMSIKYVQTSGSKYVQYRLMTDSFSTTESDWQGVDDEPVAGSKNLVESRGVSGTINSKARFLKIDSSEFPTEGFLDYAQGGNIVVNSNFRTSPYIQVEEGDAVEFMTFQISPGGVNQVSVVFYDKNKSIISNDNDYRYYVLTRKIAPSGAAYFRMSANMNVVSFEKYLKVIPKDFLDDIQRIDGDIERTEDILNMSFLQRETDITQYASGIKYTQGNNFVFFNPNKKFNKIFGIDFYGNNGGTTFYIVTLTSHDTATFEQILQYDATLGQLHHIDCDITLEDNQYLGISGYVAYYNQGNNTYVTKASGAVTWNYNMTLLFTPVGVVNVEDEEIKPFLTSVKLYSVCNDISASSGKSLGSRNYSSRMYIDHLYKDRNNMPKIQIKGKGAALPVYSIYELAYNTKYINSNVDGETLDLQTNTEKLNIIGYGVKGEEVSITHKSVRNMATADKHVRLLCIGDSVTAGCNAQANKPYSTAPETYWEWLQCLFEMDKIENGNVGFDCKTLGNYLSLPNDSYEDGHWDHLSKKTFDINFNGITKSDVNACAIAQAGAQAQWFLASQNGNNVLWDDVNNRFSLASWISKYRTLIVNADGSTTRCDNTNKGTEVTDVNAFDVCEPTHVVLAFGYNQTYGENGQVRTDFLNALNTMITRIHAEYPDVYILLSLPDTPGTYFPEMFENYAQQGNDLYSLDFTKGIAKTVHDKLCFMNKDLIDMEDESNKILYVPSYFVSPLVYGAAYRSVNDLGFLSSNEQALRQMVEAGTNGPYYHPNNTAHACWAYQLYSIIKYTLL